MRSSQTEMRGRGRISGQKRPLHSPTDQFPGAVSISADLQQTTGHKKNFYQRKLHPLRARYQDSLLGLGRLTSLSDAAAENFAKHKGLLDLRGVRRLSENAAASLGKHQGDLDLSGLKQLSDMAVRSLQPQFNKYPSGRRPQPPFY